MTALNNLPPSDLSWPVPSDAEQIKAMQTLWQAEVAWATFVGLGSPSTDQRKEDNTPD